MYIVNHRTLFFTITGILLAISLAAIVFFRLPLSIDFAGGSLVEVSYTNARPTLTTVTENVKQLALGEVSVRESGANAITVRTRTLSPEEHDKVLLALSLDNKQELTELRFNSIGPSMGAELGKKALYALLAVIGAIMLYIAWAFRSVSKPISSWVYGLVVVVILIHDILVPAGFYAILGHYTGSQVDSLFVVALLAILGYSVNDTIVIFDRIREHLRTNEHTKLVEPFDVTVGKSVTETLGRSINTSLTVVLALLALVIVGSKETMDFALVLLVGVIAGTYSSVILAAPLLIPLAKKFAKDAVIIEVIKKKR